MNASHRSPGVALEGRFRRLVELGASLLSELDLEAVLRAVVEAACELTDAAEVALGVLDPSSGRLERIVHAGGEEEPGGELAEAQSASGRRSVLAVPISVRGESFGTLYATGKRGGGEFDEADQEAARILAVWAGVAIDNARLYTALSEREAEVERALRRAETSIEISRTVGGETDVDTVLDLIVKRARALVEARTLLVMLREGERLRVAAEAGAALAGVEALTVPVEDSVFQAAMRERAGQHLRRGGPVHEAWLCERVGAEAALVVPLLHRGRAVGALIAIDREAGGGEFDAEDAQLLQAFAASAATAVATAQSVEAERLREQVDAGERERRRWARELHDETLQGLAALRIALAAALRSEAADRGERVTLAAEQTVAGLERQIEELSRLIDNLRPAPLDRYGLATALEFLAGECEARAGIHVEVDLELPGRLGGEQERVVYRLAQEALNNVVKHATARRARLVARAAEGDVTVTIADDGSGFDPAATGGRGLLGMRERVAQLGGEIEVRASPQHGTEVFARLPTGT